nr:photosystem II protein N [Fagopyrum dibotrys]
MCSHKSDCIYLDLLTLYTIPLLIKDLIRDPLRSSIHIIMETATLVAIFISGLLVSFTGYALYTAFGQPSQQLRDPFEEHGD